MKKIDKKLFLNIFIGVMTVAFVFAVVNLFFNTIEYLSLYEIRWSFGAMFLSLLGGIASLALFVVRYFKNSSGLKIAAFVTDLVVVILLFIFYITLLNKDVSLYEYQVATIVRSLLLQLFIPSLFLVLFVDVPDMVEISKPKKSNLTTPTNTSETEVQQPTNIQE